MTQLSVVIPVLNDGKKLQATLEQLQYLRAEGVELVVVDGGSIDESLEVAAALSDQIVTANRGRAEQMNRGAKVALGQYLIFLHADSNLTSDILQCLSRWKKCDVKWGFFPLRLDSGKWIFRIIERAINIRSSLTSVATGDQCLFFQRQFFEQIGGFPSIALMEDVAVSKRARAFSQPSVESRPIQTSARRWQKNGVAKTVLLMWTLRLGYSLGVSPSYLASIYYPGSKVNT